MVKNSRTTIEELEDEEGSESRLVININAYRPEGKHAADQKRHARNRPDAPIDNLIRDPGCFRVFTPGCSSLDIEKQGRKGKAENNTGDAQ